MDSLVSLGLILGFAGCTGVALFAPVWAWEGIVWASKRLGRALKALAP